MPSSRQLIASNTLSTSAATVTFSGIPATYTDLVLRMSVRTDRASSGDTLSLSINSDTSAIYSWTQLEGDGTSATSTRDSGTSYLYIPNLTAGTSTASIFVPIDIYIPNYTSTTSKPISSFSAKENDATLGYIDARSHLFRNSTAISSLVLSPNTGPNFVSGSSFYLYGIKSSGTV